MASDTQYNLALPDAHRMGTSWSDNREGRTVKRAWLPKF